MGYKNKNAGKMPALPRRSFLQTECSRDNQFVKVNKAFESGQLGRTRLAELRAFDIEVVLTPGGALRKLRVYNKPRPYKDTGN
jgi:hypothetical protein